MEVTGHTYEVFLSFRGRDTRSSFVSLLYRALTDAGIRVFKDDDDLNFGCPVADEYPRAIANSKIYMRIFSEMVSVKEEVVGKEILPIFDKVIADDVKLKTDVYMKQLSDYKTGEAAETVQLWKKDLVSCDHIQQLPVLPASLTCLCIISESLQIVPDLSNLTELKSMLLGSARKQDRARPAAELPWSNIEWIGSLSELRKLFLTISKITSIPTKFCALSQLRELTLQCLDLQCALPLPYNLTALHVSHFKQLTSLYLSLLRNLKTLTVSNCEDLAEIPGLGELESLRLLSVFNCPSLERLDDLSNLRLLERLHIEKCKKLKEIDGLESVFLRYLHIGYCNSLERLGMNPLEMNRLEYVCIEFCDSLREIHNVSGNSQLLKNNSEVNHATDIGSISSVAEQDSDSLDSSSVKEDGFAAQCSVSGSDDCHLQSSSDEEESGQTTRCPTRGSSSNSKAAAAKAVLKRFFNGGIETLAGSVDLVPVAAAAKALARVEEQSNGDYFWDNFSSKVHEASSSYKLILESIEAAESVHAKYAELKESAVEIRNNYLSVKSQMDQVQATKEKALSEIDTLRARLVELENTVVQANEQLQIASSERQVLVTAMKEQVGVMRAKQEEIQFRDAERDASHVRLNSLKAQWDSWAAHLDLVD